MFKAIILKGLRFEVIIRSNNLKVSLIWCPINWRQNWCTRTLRKRWTLRNKRLCLNLDIIWLRSSSFHALDALGNLSVKFLVVYNLLPLRNFLLSVIWVKIKLLHAKTIHEPVINMKDSHKHHDKQARGEHKPVKIRTQECNRLQRSKHFEKRAVLKSSQREKIVRHTNS